MAQNNPGVLKKTFAIGTAMGQGPRHGADHLLIIVAGIAQSREAGYPAHALSLQRRR
jgi:hypothetical protein